MAQPTTTKPRSPRPSLANVNVCGLTRLLVPAFFVAIAVSSATGSDAYGWVAAAITALVIAGVGRLRGTTASCPL